MKRICDCLVGIFLLAIYYSSTFFFLFVREEILMNTPLLLIIGNSRVVSDSYRLKFHDDHPTRTTGVLQEPLMNCLQLYPFPSSSCSSQS